MKHLQVFMGLVQDFIHSGERYVTGISTVGGEYTYTYDPDTREFLAVEDGIVKAQYNDFTNKFTQSFDKEDILCAIESMADVLSELTGEHYDKIIDREALKPAPRVKPKKVAVGTLLEEKIKALVKKAPNGFNIGIGGYQLTYRPEKDYFTMLVDNKMLAQLNILNSAGCYHFPDADYPIVSKVIDEAMTICKKVTVVLN
jgi:hypothetical protein